MESVQIGEHYYGVEEIDGRKHVLGIARERVEFIDGKIVRTPYTEPRADQLPDGYFLLVQTSVELRESADVSQPE